jgi:uncharacterized protein
VTPILLDGSVLAALTIAEHEHHDRAGRWFASQAGFAICPLTEASLVRFLLRLGESPQTALAVLARVREHPKCEFWPADLSHTQLNATSLGGADDFGQDYLAALAQAHRATVATFDTSFADRHRQALLIRN